MTARASWISMSTSLRSFGGLCPAESYEFRKKTSVTNEHRGILFLGMRTEAARTIKMFLFMDWQAFWLTFRLALIVTALLLLLGLPLAYWIAFSRWRWKFL